ncbi:MAG: chemotaxis response regulator protein-glutamate methylesterase [Proteobacteria bacterium]|nr:chemotaxis response regulator protein-glutamate methylesterase [Pseudomonadota bacterium]
MQRIKVIIVDDSASMRGLFSAMLGAAPDIEVVALAEDPYDAREKIRQHNPDVVTLDVEMPKMDGLTFLERIMTLRPMPVIMVSTLTTQGADTTLRALELGAVDYIAKPELLDEARLAAFGESLVQKVRHAAKMRGRKPGGFVPVQAAQRLTFSGDCRRQLIAIGASTGGVEALRDLLCYLPANMPPIVITQHMPELFTASFARRLDALVAPTVQEAQDGQRIEPGHVYIAPGNRHLEVVLRMGQIFCRVTEGPLVSGHKPSVDVMFQSVALLVNWRRVGVLLTGMGHDGAQGLLALRQSGSRTLGQSESSCVVYGMPRAAMQAGAVERELALEAMPRAIVQLCETQETQYAGQQH